MVTALEMKPAGVTGAVVPEGPKDKSYEERHTQAACEEFHVTLACAGTELEVAM